MGSGNWKFLESFSHVQCCQKKKLDLCKCILLCFPAMFWGENARNFWKMMKIATLKRDCDKKTLLEAAEQVPTRSVFIRNILAPTLVMPRPLPYPLAWKNDFWRNFWNPWNPEISCFLSIVGRQNATGNFFFFSYHQKYFSSTFFPEKYYPHPVGFSQSEYYDKARNFWNSRIFVLLKICTMEYWSAQQKSDSKYQEIVCIHNW